MKLILGSTMVLTPSPTLMDHALNAYLMSKSYVPEKARGSWLMQEITYPTFSTSEWSDRVGAPQGFPVPLKIIYFSAHVDFSATSSE